MKTDKLERIFFKNREWLVYGVLPLGSDWKYLLIPCVEYVEIDEEKQPIDSEGNYIGLWTNQTALDQARNNKQLTLGL